MAQAREGSWLQILYNDRLRRSPSRRFRVTRVPAAARSNQHTWQKKSHFAADSSRETYARNIGARTLPENSATRASLTYISKRAKPRARATPSPFQPFRPGVTAQWLYNDGDGGPAAVLLRYEPGARVTEHEHVGYEHVLILEGDQFDEDGSYPAGSFVVNPPGTRHSPGSKGGCVALLIYGKAVRFVEP